MSLLSWWIDGGMTVPWLTSCREGPGAILTHTPDIVALGLEAPGVYTCIEVKTFEKVGTFSLRFGYFLPQYVLLMYLECIVKYFTRIRIGRRI